MNDVLSAEFYTEERVDLLLSRAHRRDDGRYAVQCEELDEPLMARSQFPIERSAWVSSQPGSDPFEAQAADDGDGPDIFLRVQGTITSAGKDDNGVTLFPASLRTLPDDFKQRTTVLFNHARNLPIGRIIETKVAGGNGSAPTRARITTDIRRDAISDTQVPYANLIQSGVLTKYSMAWVVLRGEIIFDFSEDRYRELDDDRVAMSFGTEFMPEVNVFSLRGLEASVVSVPALAQADIDVGVAFARSLGVVGQRWSETDAGLLVPRSERRSVRFQKTRAIDAPWDVSAAMKRVSVWSASQDTSGAFEQAYCGFRTSQKDGVKRVEEYYLFHHDIRDGELVSNLRGVKAAAAEIEHTQFESEAARSSAKAHLRREFVETHGCDPEDVPDVLND
jgi:hypothetical protein